MKVRDYERQWSEAASSWTRTRETELREEIRRVHREWEFTQAVWRDTMLTRTEARYLGRSEVHRWTDEPREGWRHSVDLARRRGGRLALRSSGRRHCSRSNHREGEYNVCAAACQSRPAVWAAVQVQLVTPAHALRQAGKAAGHDDAHIAERIEQFYAALRAAEPADAKQMIDNPTGWNH